MLDKLDNLFLDILMKHRKPFDDIMTKSLKYDIKMTPEIFSLKTMNVKVKYGKKTTDNKIILFGQYNRDDEEFIWIGDYNKALLEHLKRYNPKELFGSMKTINKLFKKTLKIKDNVHLAIPFLIAILNPSFNLISFENKDKSIYLYALVNLGMKDNFNMDKFTDDMEVYKKMAKK